MNPMIAIRQKDGVTIVEVSGKLIKHGSCDELRETICGLAQNGRKRILLYLAGVTHIDSSGMGELVAAYTTLADAGGQMKFLGVGPRMRHLLSITNLDTVFEIYEDEASALRSFRSPEPAHHEALAELSVRSELFFG